MYSLCNERVLLYLKANDQLTRETVVIICKKSLTPDELRGFVDVKEVVPALVTLTGWLSNQTLSGLENNIELPVWTKVTVFLPSLDQIRLVAEMLMTMPAISHWGGVEFFCKESVPEEVAHALLAHMQSRRRDIRLKLHPPP